MPLNYKTEYQKYRRYYQSLEPMMQKPQAKRYTAVVFSFLAVSLFGWYALRPTIQTILHLRREIADKKAVNQKMDEKITALIEAQAVYQELEEQVPAVSEALPDSPELIPYVAQIKKLAAETDVTIRNITIPPAPLFADVATASAAKRKNLRQLELPVSLVASGAYDKVKAFIDGILTLRRVATVDEVSLAPIRDTKLASPSASQEGGLVQVAVKLKVYYLAP